MFIDPADQLVSKTYMTRVEGDNTALRYDLAQLHRQTLCYSKSVEMLKRSLRLLLHYLKYRTVPLPALFIPVPATPDKFFDHSSILEVLHLSPNYWSLQSSNRVRD